MGRRAVEEPSSLPEGWLPVRLADVADVVGGGRLGLTKEKSYQTSGFPAYSAAGKDGFVDVWEFDRPGVVLSAIGARCGKCFLADGKWTTLANTQAILPNLARLDACFLHSYVNDENYWHRSGSAQPFIKPSDVKQAWIALPPLAEQRRIAALLQAAADAVAAAEAVIVQTEKVKRGLVEQLLTRGMPGRHTRFKLTEIGEVPESWEVLPLRECIAEGPQYGANASKAPFIDGKPRFVRITDINAAGTLEEERVGIDEVIATPFLLREGDVVLARSGATVGKSYRYKATDGLCAFAGYLIRVRPDANRLTPAFFEEYLASDQYWAWVTASQRAGAQPNINGQEYVEMRLPIPPVAEQEEIADALGQFRAANTVAGRTAGALRSVAAAVSNDLLSGRVRVGQ